jgi:molecular chaperone DnaK
MKIRKTLGIDLGTTNSVIALLDPTDSAILTGRDGQGRTTVPSVIARHQTQDRLVAGWEARQLRRSGRPLVASVKRHMGLDRQFDLGAEQFSAVELSARILRHCRDLIASTLNDPRYLFDSAVITVPAYFNHTQIEDTRRAGELAGFEVAELLHEPTAAAMYYAWVEGHADATYLVYDLGGGTFDVSVIRRRFDDYEVVGVSGDPFLGGDDFDRTLASHLQEQVLKAHPRRVNFDLQHPDGRANFASLVDVAERLKVALADQPSAEVHNEAVASDEDGGPVRLDATVERSTFHTMIREKINRTVDCCREALARAKEKCGLTLSGIDHVILVGGSSRIPLVRETIRAAFCNQALPEHARQAEPLLHEPDLCVAYGAALRAATHGTRFVFPVDRKEDSPGGLLPDLDLEIPLGDQGLDVELHLTSPVNVRDVRYTLTGVLRGAGAAEVRHGGSLRVRHFASGLTEETFLGRDGGFALDLELAPETDNALEMIVCDNLGQELARIPACVRHRSADTRGVIGPGVLPTQLITKPLSIEVLDRGRHRVKQILAPVGAALPGTFRATCRTVDQGGKIIVPIFEENRVIKQMMIDGLDTRLPPGSPVDVEFNIDLRHTVEVKVVVRGANRTEAIRLEGPPPPDSPTLDDIQELKSRIEELLQELAGGFRARVRARLTQVVAELNEARFYEDEPKAIQRMAELQELLQEVEAEKARQLQPPWHQFAHLAETCRAQAAEAARVTGRGRGEMLDYVRAQERHAERAFQERNQPLYREAWGNLERYLYTLQDLVRAATPPEEEEWHEEPDETPEDQARAEVERFRNFLSHVWKEARTRGRKDLEERFQAIAKTSQGVSQRVKEDAGGTLRSVRRWMKELHKLAVLIREGRNLGDEDSASGLLEGTL